MDDILTRYLDAYPWHHEMVEHWPIQGELRLRLCLATALPPAHVSSSILAIVLDSDRRVLYLWPSSSSGSIAHLLIGGRPLPGETPEATAMREVGEETGWRVEPIQMIGFRHFSHLEPKSEKSDRPCPDFIQPIYAAVAVEFDPSLLVLEDHIESEFVNFEEAERMTDPPQRPLLYAAAAELKTRMDDRVKSIMKRG